LTAKLSPAQLKLAESISYSQALVMRMNPMLSVFARYEKI